MDVLLDWRSRVNRRARSLLLFVSLGAGVVACGEDLESGAACPVLCPGQSVSVFDTTFEAVALDSTVDGIPGFGTEDALVLADRGDTLDVRAVVRFDTIPSTFLKNAGDSTINRLDSARVTFTVIDTVTRVRGSVRLDVFDVDTADADTVAAVVKSLFRQDRLIGSVTLDSAAVKDSIRIPLSNVAVLRKITAKSRLRLGVKLTTAAGGQIVLGSLDGGATPQLRFRPAPEDTSVRALTITPTSGTPASNATVAADFADYTLVFKAPAIPGGTRLSVGGIPSRRIYFRFNVPSRILDSSTVLRASLLLTQLPNRAVLARDTVAVVPEYSTAAEDLADVTRSALLTSGFTFDTLRVAPGDSGLRVLEVATAVRAWAAAQSSTIKQQNALILRSTREARSPFELHFSSREGPAALRPRLRVSYALRTSFGIP
ncbi:MAG TPA: hypothetical protein VFV33_04970 [Gemmatimonadaceae bacterium]|nr:hypothetical protein [Gemmatimonadaceae bacterium]